MKRFLKYFLILGLSYSCAAMTPEQHAEQQTKLARLIERVETQQAAINNQSQESYVSKAFKVLGVTAATGVTAAAAAAAAYAYLAQSTKLENLVTQNANLQIQFGELAKLVDAKHHNSFTKVLCTLLFTHPLAWLPILL